MNALLPDQDMDQGGKNQLVASPLCPRLEKIRALFHDLDSQPFGLFMQTLGGILI